MAHNDLNITSFFDMNMDHIKDIYTCEPEKVYLEINKLLNAGYVQVNVYLRPNEAAGYAHFKATLIRDVYYRFPYFDDNSSASLGSANAMPLIRFMYHKLEEITNV